MKLIAFLVCAPVCFGQSASQQLLVSQKIAAASSIALVNSTSVKDSTGTGIATLSAPAQNHTAGNLLVVMWRGGVSGGVTISDTAGDTFSAVSSSSETSTGELKLFYAKNIAGNASNVVTANWSNNTSFDSVIVLQYSGLSTSAPLDTTAVGNSGGTPGTTLTSGSFTTTVANEVIVAVASWDNLTVTMTAGSGYTVEVQDAAKISGAEDKIVSAIQTTVTATATISSSQNWIICVGTFK